MSKKALDRLSVAEVGRLVRERVDEARPGVIKYLESEIARRESTGSDTRQEGYGVGVNKS